MADLAVLPALYDDMEDALAVPTRGTTVRVSGSRANGLLIDEAVATVRSTTISVLASWAGMVAAERAVPGPEREVRSLAAFLAEHVDWMAAQVTAGDLSGEISRLAASARRVAHFEPARRVSLGTCVHDACDSPMYAKLGAEEDGGVPWRIACKAGHVWPPDQWPLLRLRLHPDAFQHADRPAEAEGTPAAANPGTVPEHFRRILPTRLAAAIMGVTETTVRKWASRGRLTRYGSPRRAEYDLDELAVLVAEKGQADQ
jgi:hypothetical protein